MSPFCILGELHSLSHFLGQLASLTLNGIVAFTELPILTALATLMTFLSRYLAGGRRHQRRHPHPLHLHAAVGRFLVREGRQLPDLAVGADVTGRDVRAALAHHSAGS